MRFVDKVLSKEEIKKIRRKYGEYVKVTVDIEKKVLIVGCRLHADGEKILLEHKSRQNDIWGGGISFAAKEIDATAVLNIRPKLNNPSMEILEPKIREKLKSVVRKLFTHLWN